MNKKARCACGVLVLLTGFLTFSLPSPTLLLKGNSSMINVTNTYLSSLELVADPFANFTRLP